MNVRLFEETFPDFDSRNTSFWDVFQFESLHMPPSEIAIKTVVLMVIVGIGLMGNLSIFIIITKNRLLRLQATNLFLLNMACADFLTLLVIPFLYYFKQKVIFRLYKLGRVPCRMTPFLIVTFFLSGSLSLMVISLNRMFGIVFPNNQWLRLRRKTVMGILVVIWIVSIAFAAPTTYYRRFWTRTWKDLIEENCDDEFDGEGEDWHLRQCDFKISYFSYWLSNLAINVWVPTIVMFVSYAVIFVKLKQSLKAFPYISEQRRVARSRRGVIKMLFLLFLVQLICWGPWQFHTVFDAYVWFVGSEAELCFENHTKFGEFSNALRALSNESNLTTRWADAEPIIHDIKFYFIFANSALNPIIYGYCNETMRKAFRITFICLFKEKPKYVLQRGGAGNSPFSFSRTITKPQNNKVSKAVHSIGESMMAPINPRGQQLAYPKTRISRITKLTKKVVVTTSDNLKIRSSAKKASGKLKASAQIQSTSVSQTYTSSPKKVSFFQDNSLHPYPSNLIRKKKSKHVFRSKHISENYSFDSEPCPSNIIEHEDFAIRQTSMTVSSISQDSSMKLHLDIKLDIQMRSSDLNLNNDKKDPRDKNQAEFRTRRKSDPGPVKIT